VKVTICLVTRGRSQFIQECLVSLQGCLQSGLADVLLFDNGSPYETSKKLHTWSQQNSVDYIRYEENDSRPSRWWEEVCKRGLEWVVFPGDDDIFIPDSLAIFYDVMTKNSSLSAISFNMNTIDITGRNLQQVRKPAYKQSVSPHIAVARSFHEPQFLWPSLFFRADLIGTSVPTSRFYFDWWVGQNLIIHGNIAVVNSSSIEYRIHPLQESSLANNRRKYFEATHWTISLIESKIFSQWIMSLSKDELLEFWGSALLHKPIYSSEYYAGVILERLSQVLLNTRPEFNLFAEVLGTLASSKGVWLRSGELSNFISNGSLSKESYPPNISINTVPGSCSILTTATNEFAMSLNLSENYVVSCTHSPSIESDFQFDCEQFQNLENDQVADQIIFQLNERAENLGKFEFITTGKEKSLILLLRRIKVKIPGRILTFIKFLASRVGRLR